MKLQERASQVDGKEWGWARGNSDRSSVFEVGERNGLEQISGLNEKRVN